MLRETCPDSWAEKSSTQVDLLDCERGIWDLDHTAQALVARHSLAPLTPQAGARSLVMVTAPGRDRFVHRGWWRAGQKHGPGCLGSYSVSYDPRASPYKACPSQSLGVSLEFFPLAVCDFAGRERDLSSAQMEGVWEDDELRLDLAIPAQPPASAYPSIMGL